MAVLTKNVARPWPYRWSLRALMLGLLLACSATPGAFGASAKSIPDEYRVKAVFLFNFAQFVEWPPRAFSHRADPIVVGILGEDPFGTYLDDLVGGEHVGERAFLVERYQRVEDIARCHILFISRSESAHLDHVLAHLRDQSILTISDAERFTQAGGIVRFVMENGKIRLRINVDAARKSHLEISSKLLRPSTIVTAGN